MNHYAIITADNRVLDVFASEHDAGHPAVINEGTKRSYGLAERAQWVYVEEPCQVGDVLDVDLDGCATVVRDGMRFPVGARVESVGGGEDDECGYVRANLPGDMVEVGWDSCAVSVAHGSALRLI